MRGRGREGERGGGVRGVFPSHFSLVSFRPFVSRCLKEPRGFDTSGKEQIVDVPLPHVVEEVLEVVENIRISENAQIVDVPVPPVELAESLGPERMTLPAPPPQQSQSLSVRLSLLGLQISVPEC